MNFIRSSILKVTFEGKSGCGLTLYSLGTSRSNVTTGKKQHFPHQFSPAGLLFQMAGRHTRYFRACTVCLHFLLGKAQVFLDGVCRVLFGCVCPLCVVHHRRMAAWTLSERAVCLAGWWSEPNIYPNKFILIMCQMEWRMQAQTFLSLSFFFFGCISSIYVHVQSVLTSFAERNRFSYVFYVGPILRPRVALSHWHRLVLCWDQPPANWPIAGS